MEKYKEFVPWCIDSKIVEPPKKCDDLQSQSDEVFYAEITAGFLNLTDSYTSKVEVIGNKVIAEASDSRLFSKLHTVWVVSDAEGGCFIDFSIEFEFNSYIYAYFANLFFIEVSKGMISSFEKRCTSLEKWKAQSEIIVIITIFIYDNKILSTETECVFSWVIDIKEPI